MFAYTDPAERIAQAVGLALVEPKLDEAQARELLRGAAGRMAPLIQRVMALAGMLDGDEADSLAGAGS